VILFLIVLVLSETVLVLVLEIVPPCFDLANESPIELNHDQLGICVSPQPLLPLTPRDTSTGSPHDTPSTEFG
jgi:hypothetical protein